MKPRYQSLFFLLLLIPQIGFASETEILWMKFEKIFTYKDIDRFCSTKDLPSSILFGAEVLDGKVQAATFKTDTIDVLADRLPLTADEIVAVQIGTDKNERKWIENINLNARQLNWIFTRAGGMDECVPTQPLATLGPNEFKYAFNLSEVLVQPQIFSNLGRFSGKRKDGRLYQITLILSQKPIP